MFLLLFVGRESLTRLANAGIKCSYVLISAVSYIMKEVSFITKIRFLNLFK